VKQELVKSMFAIAIRSLNALLMIAMPLVLGVFLARKLGVVWRLFGIGAITFIASQVFHIPFNFWVLTPLLEELGLRITQSVGGQLLIIAVVYGLSAGVFEEMSRYIVFRFWLKSENNRTWRSALMFGAGHGGIEAILFGVLAAVALVQLFALRDADLATIIPADQLEIAKRQIDLYWSFPWYGSLLGAVERAIAICFHLSATVMVLQVFKRKNILWLGAAIVWHTILNTVAVYAGQTWGIYITEMLLVVLGFLSLAIIFLLREPVEFQDEPRPDVEVLSLEEIEVNDISIDNLENSRYV
jgi:uncharacterized membrane protein YhfC